MSASREKKQRQTPEAQILSPKEQEERAKAAKRKRNTVVYIIIGIVAVIVVAGLITWNTGIFQRNATAATVGDEEVPCYQVAFYYYRSANNLMYYAQMYEQFGMEFPYSTSLGSAEQTLTQEAVDTLSSMGIAVDEDMVGLTYHEYFLQSALNAIQQEYALLAAANEAGYTLSEAGQESVESSLEALDSQREDYLSQTGTHLSRSGYLKLVYNNMLTESLYRECLERSTLVSEYYSNCFDAVPLYSEEELESYYSENAADLDSYDYAFRLFSGTAESTEDEDGNTVEPTEEEQAAAMAEAQEQAEAAKAELQADPSLTEDNDDYTTQTGIVGATIGDTFYDWLTDTARTSGDVEVFETETGYYVIQFQNRERVDTPTADVRHILISAMPEDDPETEDVDESTEAPTDEDYAAAEAEAQRILDEWKAGEATEASFAALAEEYSADTGSNTNGGLYRNVYQGRMIPAFDEWVFGTAHDSGDTGLVQNTESSIKGWHIIYYVKQSPAVWQTTAAEALWSDGLDTTLPIATTDKVNTLFD